MAKAPSKKRDTALIGYLAVSADRATRIKAFNVMPGFDADQPKRDFEALLAEGDDWCGFAIVARNGKPEIRRIQKDASPSD